MSLPPCVLTLAQGGVPITGVPINVLAPEKGRIHLLNDLPDEISGCAAFWKKRRESCAKESQRPSIRSRKRLPQLQRRHR